MLVIHITKKQDYNVYGSTFKTHVELNSSAIFDRSGFRRLYDRLLNSDEFLFVHVNYLPLIDMFRPCKKV